MAASRRLSSADYEQNQISSRKTMKSTLPFVIKKLKNHPCYKDAGENELRQEAEDLTDADKIMERFFSSITYKLVNDTFTDYQEDSERELLTTYEKKLQTARSEARIEDVAKFQVKLLLRHVDGIQPPPKVIGKIAAILNMEYGPMHASLLINDEILLEWNSSDLVIPRFIDPREKPVLVAATVKGHHKIQRHLSMPFQNYDEVQLMFDAASAKIELFNKLSVLIASYNSAYYYHTIFRNCQTFILDALAAIGCKEKPEFSDKLKEYFVQLKKKGKVKGEFHTHKELNTYVKENIARMSPANLEYLLAQYYLLHIESIRKCNNPENWQCSDEGCLMPLLEAKIREQDLIMNQYLQREVVDHTEESS